jgi:AraC-like DNA-binding protein
MCVTDTSKIWIADIENYIMNNLEKRVRITELVQHFHVSESVLTKGFKTVYNSTIHQYHLQKSMELALTELQNGASVKELAIRFGYKHSWSFTRAFKRIHRFAPVNYN